MSRLSQLTLLALPLTLAMSSISLGQESSLAAPPSLAVRPESAISQIEARIHDLADAIAAYTHDSELPADEAREEAVRHLMAPFAEHAAPIKREEIAPGQFKIWAPRSFHEFLPGVVAWLKHGKKTIRFDVRIVTVPEETLKDLHAKFGKQWEVTSTGEGEATKGESVVSPAQPESPIKFASLKKQSNSSADLLSASVTTVKSLPCRLARLTATQAKELILTLQADSSSSTLQAPTVTLFPGQHATIKEASQRPFVVSVKPITADGQTAMQPIIQVLEDGTSMNLTASLQDNDQLDIEGEFTFKRIGDVDHFTFQSPEVEEGITVQIPEHHVRHVRISKAVDQGATLLIDPHFVEEKTTKKRFRRPVTKRDFTIVLLTPRIVDHKPQMD